MSTIPFSTWHILHLQHRELLEAVSYQLPYQLPCQLPCRLFLLFPNVRDGWHLPSTNKFQVTRQVRSVLVASLAPSLGSISILILSVRPSLRHPPHIRDASHLISHPSPFTFHLSPLTNVTISFTVHSSLYKTTCPPSRFRFLWNHPLTFASPSSSLVTLLVTGFHILS